MASRLNDRELKVRKFILDVFGKKINITSTVFKRVVKVCSEERNKEIVDTYGERIYSSMLAEYKFKNYNDYIEKMDLLKTIEYLGTGKTQYASATSIIIKKLFDSESVRVEWIITSLKKASIYELRNVIQFLFTREKNNLHDWLVNLTDDLKGTKNEYQVLSEIFKNIMMTPQFKDISLIIALLERIGHNQTIIDTIIGLLDNNRAHKKVLDAIYYWLYQVTSDPKYLPSDINELFFV